MSRDMGCPEAYPTVKTATFLVVTLGCAKNEVDSDRMRALLLNDGFAETASVEDADVVLVNTCSFIAAAVSESIEVTLDLVARIEQGVRQKPIVMCGCMPSRYDVELSRELPEVAAFVRAQDEDGIVDVVRGVLGLPPGPPLSRAIPGGSNQKVLRTVYAASAYVKISDGCDRFCTFCAIPYIRGHYRSRPADIIAQEVRSLAAGGVREFVLIGQDTGVWGVDLDEPSSLAVLLRQLAAIVSPFGGWVRVLYLQPEGMTDELIATIRDVPEVLPYIDIPIQHCSTRVLRRMGRSGSREEFRALFARLRRDIPGMVLRTTAMAGFPGETQEEADELCQFLTEEGFDYTSVFAYSPEEGTPAAAMPDQVSDDVKLERTQRLHDIAEACGFAATARHVGERLSVIIDGVDEGEEGPELIGHAWFQAPDSDGAVHISSGEAAAGDVVTCDIQDSVCYELYGRIVEGSNI